MTRGDGFDSLPAVSHTFRSLAFALLLGCNSIAGSAHAQAPTAAPALETETFVLQGDFLAAMESAAAEAGGKGATDRQRDDPFSSKPPQTKVLKSSQTILEQAGVSFPPGAAASFDPDTGALTMRNTPLNLSLTRGLILSYHKSLPKSILAVAYHFEVPASTLEPMLAESSAKLDHTPHLKQLLEWSRQPHSGVRLRQVAGGRFSPGHRIRLHSLAIHHEVRESRLNDGLWTTKIGEAQAGLALELDTTLDQRMDVMRHSCSITVDADGPGPAPARELEAHVQLLDGQSHLLSWWPGGGDTREVVFLRNALASTHAWPRPAPPPTVGLPEDSGTGLSEIFELPVEPFPHADTEADWLAMLALEGLPLPEGTTVLRENKGRRWIVQGSPTTRDTFRRYVSGLWHPRPASLTATVHIIRGPISALLPLVETSAWQEAPADSLDAAVARGEASHAATLHLSGLLDGTSHLASGFSRQYPATVRTSPATGTTVDLETTHRGFKLELGAGLMESGNRVPLSLLLAQSTPVSDPPRIKGIDGSLELPGEAHASMALSTALTVADGESRLLGWWTPPGNPDNLMEAAILTTRLVRNRPMDHSPVLTNAGPPADPLKVETKVFAAYSSLISEATTSPESPAQLSLRPFLEKQGILFVEGGFAIFEPAATSIVARTNRENLELIEAFLKTIGELPEPDFWAATFHVFEAPAPFVRGLLSEQTRQPGGKGVLERLREAEAQGAAKEIDASRITGFPGGRFHSRQSSPFKLTKRLTVSPDGQTLPETDALPAAGFLQVEHTEGAPGRGLADFDVAWEKALSPPSFRQENLRLPGIAKPASIGLQDQPRIELKASRELPENASQILAVWPPPGSISGGLLQIAVLECQRVRYDNNEAGREP